MTQKELIIWHRYIKTLRTLGPVGQIDGMEKEDYRELLRLNFLVMELAHKIHNDNMLENRCEPWDVLSNTTTTPSPTISPFGPSCLS